MHIRHSDQNHALTTEHPQAQQFTLKKKCSYFQMIKQNIQKRIHEA